MSVNCVNTKPLTGDSVKKILLVLPRVWRSSVVLEKGKAMTIKQDLPDRAVKSSYLAPEADVTKMKRQL